MNKVLIVSSLFLITNIANAEGGYRLVSTDNSALSALCITAVEAPEAVSKSARAIGMSSTDMAELRCNGQTLPVFVHRFRETESNPTIVYSFNKTDASEETELCYAAVSSEQQYNQVKDTYFDDELNIEEEVMCNGMPIKTFARKYRNRAFTASTK